MREMHFHFWFGGKLTLTNLHKQISHCKCNAFLFLFSKTTKSIIFGVKRALFFTVIDIFFLFTIVQANRRESLLSQCYREGVANIVGEDRSSLNGDGGGFGGVGATGNWCKCNST